MQITYVKDSAGIKAGTVKTLPDKLALKLVEMGIAVETGLNEMKESEGTGEEMEAIETAVKNQVDRAELVKLQNEIAEMRKEHTDATIEVDALGEITGEDLEAEMLDAIDKVAETVIEEKQAAEPETRETKPHKGANNRKTK